MTQEQPAYLCEGKWKNDKIKMHGWGKWDILDIIYFLSALHADCTIKEKTN